MKKLFLFLVFAAISLSVFSQHAYRCVYEEQILFSKSMPPVEDEAIMNAIKQAFKERKQIYNLVFFDGKSLFERDRENSTDNFSPSDLGVVYVDMNKGEKITQEDFFGKKFLITEELQQVAWNITEETAVINGYNCIKASFSDTLLLGGMDIEAWFSPEIPIPAGPMGFGGLPGLIVKLGVGDMMLMTLSDAKIVDDAEIKAPKKGKKVTREEYSAIQKKKLEEFRSKMPDFGDDNIQILMPPR